MESLESALSMKVRRRNGDLFQPDFRVSVQGKKEGGLHIMLHPLGYRVDAFHFIVKENKVIPLRGSL